MKKTSYISAKYLEIDPMVKRHTYDPAIQEKLFEDIRENGFKTEHPLVVRPNLKKRGCWLIVSGQHRFEAGLKAGVSTFPCIEKEYENNVLITADAYKDNTLVCPVDAITEAIYFDTIGKEMLKMRGHNDESIEGLERKYPHERIALQTGVTRDYVVHRLKLLKLPPFVQWMIKRYYQPSQKGQKLSPTIGEELVRIMDLLKKQNVINLNRAMFDLALLFWKEKVTLHEARKIAAEIAYHGYDKWKYRGKVVIENIQQIRCAVCGKDLSEEDMPWTPLCIDHKYQISSGNATNRVYSKGAINPNRPLHEIDPETHKPKRPDIEKGQNKGAAS